MTNVGYTHSNSEAFCGIVCSLLFLYIYKITSIHTAQLYPQKYQCTIILPYNNLVINTVEPPSTDILYSGHLITKLKSAMYIPGPQWASWSSGQHSGSQHLIVRIEFALHVILYSPPKCGYLAIL